MKKITFKKLAPVKTTCEADAPWSEGKKQCA